MRPVFRWIVPLGIAFAIVASPGPAAEVPNQVPLTREGAIEMAIRANLDLRIEALSTSLAEASLAGSKGYYNPVLNTSATTGETTFPGEDFGTQSTVISLGMTQYLPIGGSVTASTSTGYTTADSATPGFSTHDWQSTLGVTYYQPLLKNAGWEATNLNISLADNSLVGSLESFRFFLADTVFSVITNYNRLYVLRQTLEARKNALDSAQNLVKDLSSTVHPGPLHQMNLANAEYALSQRRKDLVDIQRNVTNQEASLRYLIGMKTDSHLIPVDPPSREEPMETIEQAVETALAQRSDLRQLRVSLESNLLQERVARRRVLPDLSLTASGGMSSIADTIDQSYEQIAEGDGLWWQAGLLFSLPLGNDTAENSYRQAKIRSNQLSSRIAAFAWQIQNAIETDMRALISARLQMQTADRSVEYGEQRLSEYRRHQREGKTSIQDVLNAENDLIAARTSQLDALENFAYNVALLWRDMGVLLDRKGIRIDASKPGQLTASIAPETPPAPSPPPETKMPPPSPQAPLFPSQLYVLQIGEFRQGDELEQAIRQVRRAGLVPVIAPGLKGAVPMHRLLAGKFADLEPARQLMDRLKAAKAESFLLKEDGQFAVYAGSYSQREGAQEERRRLAARGFTLTLEPVTRPSPTSLLSTTPFRSKETAMKAVTDLERQGLLPELQTVTP